MGSNLHTPPEVNDAANLACVYIINKCGAGTRWGRQVYMVESVECIPLECQVNTLGYGEGLSQREVHFTIARAQQAVASGIPEGVLRGLAIGRWIVPFIAVGVSDVRIANEIRSIIDRRI